MIADDKYGQCPNLKENEREGVRDVIEVSQKSVTAGKKSNPDEPSPKAIAKACRRAAVSIGFATDVCPTGKRSRMD